MADGRVALAGGTDLMVEVNFGQARPEKVVGLRRVAELHEWEANRIGAGVTWRRLESDGPHRAGPGGAHRRLTADPECRHPRGQRGDGQPGRRWAPFLAAVDASIELDLDCRRREPCHGTSSSSG